MSDAVDLGYRPREWQNQAHLGLMAKRWGVLVCHRRAGKTVLAVMQLIDRACRIEKPNARFAYIAPQLKQAKAIAWFYVKQYATRIPGTVVHESELRVTLRNGAEIRIHGADNPDALRGIYLDGVVVDEVANVSKELWDSVLRPALSDRKGWALFMGTPGGVDLLSELYFAARDKPDWYTGHFTVHQTNAIEADEVRALQGGEMTVNAFNREYLCDFSAAVDNVLLSVNDVEAATRRNAQEPDFAHSPKIVGVDVARQGDDRSVIVRRQGICCYPPQVFRGLDSMQLAAQVALVMNEWEPDAVFVDGSGGYGAGVVDRLRQLRHRVTEVQFGGKADDPRYANKRAEMWFRAAEWVKANGILPNNADLKQDLCAPTYGYDAQGRLLLEAKDKIKQRGLPSPDCGDGLVLTFAHPVPSRDVMLRRFAPFARQQQEREYDPLGMVRDL